jgi:hypothetical protein
MDWIIASDSLMRFSASAICLSEILAMPVQTAQLHHQGCAGLHVTMLEVRRLLSFHVLFIYTTGAKRCCA